MTCSVSRLIRKTELKKCSRISLLVVLVTCKYAPSLLEFPFSNCFPWCAWVVMELSLFCKNFSVTEEAFIRLCFCYEYLLI